MTALTSTEWSLAARPVGMPKLSDFQKKTIDIAPPGAGEIQVKNEWMSVDPYMRRRNCRISACPKAPSSASRACLA